MRCKRNAISNLYVTLVKELSIFDGDEQDIPALAGFNWLIRFTVLSSSEVPRPKGGAVLSSSEVPRSKGGAVLS